MYTFHAAGSIQRLQPSLLAALTSDLQTTSRRLLDLRELLPAANVSALVARRPQLLLQDTADVKAAVAALRRLLPLGGEHQVDRWVPFYLNACRTIWPYSPHTVCPPTPFPFPAVSGASCRMQSWARGSISSTTRGRVNMTHAGVAPLGPDGCCWGAQGPVLIVRTTGCRGGGKVCAHHKRKTQEAYAYQVQVAYAPCNNKAHTAASRAVHRPTAFGESAAHVCHCGCFC